MSERAGSLGREDGLDQAVESFLAELRAGARPSIEDYAARHPDRSAELTEMLEAVAMIEGGRLAAPTDPATRPERIASYRIRGELGRGAMGVVYEALQEPLGRVVALKLLSDQRLAAPDALARFQREAAVAARLEHPGICAVIDAGVDRGTAYIAMRRVDGESLARRLERARRDPAARLAPDEVALLIERLARAVHAAHAAGVVHRDLKPANVMIAPGGEPVVLDFGLARDLSGGAEELTRTGDACGTPAYLAPERLDRRSGRVAPSADVYALGVILYECLALRRPFEAPTLASLYRQCLEADPPDVRRFQAAASRDLVAVVEAALEKDPARRYASAEHLADDLAACREGRAVSVRRVGAAGRLARWARRDPARAALAFGAVAALVALSGLGAFLTARWPELRSARVLAAERDLEERLERGFLAIGEGQPGEASRLFEELAAAEPSSVEALAGLALGRLRDGRPSSALELLDAHAAELRAHPALAAIRGDALRLLGRPAEIPEGGPARPADALGHALGALRELELGHAGDRSAFARALAGFGDAIRLSRQARALYWFGRAHAAAHAGAADAARESAERIADFWPDSPTGRFFFAFALSEIGDPRAIEAWRAAAESDPASVRAHYNLALGLQKAGRPEQAEAVYARTLELDPTHAHSRWNLGTVRRRLGDQEVALDSLCTALRDTPSLLVASAPVESLSGAEPEFETVCRARAQRDALAPEPWWLLAILAEGRCDYPAAAAADREALARAPESAAAHHRLARTLWRAGPSDEGVRLLERAAQLDPASPAIRRQLVLGLRDVGRIADGVAACRAALEAIPLDAQLSADLGSFLIYGNHPDEAVVALERAVALGSRTARTLCDLGTVQGRLGRYEAAVASLSWAVELDPEHAEAWCNLGGAHKHLGDFSAALDAYSRGHELGSAREGWRYPSARWVQECEELAASEVELEAWSRGERGSIEPARLASLAWTAQLKGRFGEAVALYREAFAGDPGLAEASSGRHRYNAACSAARAGDLERALAWLAQELAEWERRAGAAEIGPDALAAELERWKSDPDLAVLREPAHADGGDARAALWDEVDRLAGAAARR